MSDPMERRMTFFCAPRITPQNYSSSIGSFTFKMKVMQKFVKEIKRKYKLRGYTDDDIMTWIVIQFKCLEEQMKLRKGFILEDAIEEKKPKKVKQLS